MKINKKLKVTVVVLIIAYMIPLGVMYFGQHKSEYQPKLKTQQEFEDVANTLGAEIVKYKTHDGLTNESLYFPAKDGYPIFLYFNGNAGTIEQAHIKFKPFIDEGYGVFVNVFRGFGANPGVPSEYDFFKDADTVYDFVLHMGYAEDEEDIIIYGYSLGTGIAVHLSSQKPNSKSLIVEGGFTSATDVAKAWFPYLPVSLLLKDKYESEVYIQSISQPKLHLHGDIDLKVPTRFGRRLHEGASEKKEFHLFEGGTHGNLQELGSTQIIKNFIEN